MPASETLQVDINLSSEMELTRHNSAIPDGLSPSFIRDGGKVVNVGVNRTLGANLKKGANSEGLT